jgi:glycogen debranching enzyme
MKYAWNGWTWNEYGQKIKRNKRITSNSDGQERIEVRKKFGGHATCGPLSKDTTMNHKKKMKYEKQWVNVCNCPAMIDGMDDSKDHKRTQYSAHETKETRWRPPQTTLVAGRGVVSSNGRTKGPEKSTQNKIKLNENPEGWIDESRENEKARKQNQLRHRMKSERG